MSIRIVHIVDHISRTNYGIWNAAIFGSEFIKRKFACDSVLLVCSNKVTSLEKITIPVRYLGWRPSVLTVTNALAKLRIDSNNTVVVTHGCWLKPTRLGHDLKLKGFRWIYVPHGMLEPWSLQNGKWKKWIYFRLFEKRWSAKSDMIRAVSKREQLNLAALLGRKVVCVENGTKLPLYEQKPGKPITFLFMARLHYKKGILPLVKAWMKTMQNISNARLLIAGPDEGELKLIKPYLNESLQYIGPIYDKMTKEQLLATSHYFVLPSFSEGFPTSVLEAMSFGLIPLISEGCNFPEVIEQQLGYAIEPDEEHIARQLIALAGISFDQELSQRNRIFVEQYFSEHSIGAKLNEMYHNVLSS